MKCPTCGATMKDATIKEYDAAALFGVSSVTINGFRALRCPKSGDILLGGAVIEQAERLLAMAIITRGDVLRGETIRFLRKRMALSQSDLAERLGVHRVTVARWETDAEAISPPASIAIRAMALLGMLEEPGVDRKKVRGLFDKPPRETPRPRGFRLELKKAS